LFNTDTTIDLKYPSFKRKSFLQEKKDFTPFLLFTYVCCYVHATDLLLQPLMSCLAELKYILKPKEKMPSAMMQK
jgi:hypothetical protein